MSPSLKREIARVLPRLPFAHRVFLEEKLLSLKRRARDSVHDKMQELFNSPKRNVRRVGVSTLNRYSHGLGFFEDFADFSGGWEDTWDPAAEFGDVYGDYATGDLIDYGGDTVLSVDEFFPDDLQPDYDFGNVIEGEFAEPSAYDYSFDGSGVEPESGVPDYDVPGFSEPSAPIRVPSLPSISLPAPAPISTGGPNGLLTSIVGGAVQAATRRVEIGQQQPGTIYMPGARPGMVNLPGQPGATQYRPPVASPTAAKVADFVKKNALPLALAAGALLFFTMKPAARSSRRAR